jgi:conjugative relaxase-like TrwC/TraI family protein
MISISTQTSAGALDYYEKDDYYSRDGNGEWYGKLKDDFNLNKFSKDDYDRILKENERFRTYDLKYTVAKETANKFKDNEIFQSIQQKAMEKVNQEIAKDCRFKIKEDSLKTGNSRGKDTFIKVTSHNVAAKNFGRVEKTLDKNSEKYNNIYQKEMMKGCKNNGLEVKKDDFKFKSYTNSGRIGNDICFSPPKSVAIYANMSDANYNLVQECQRNAVNQTLDFIEKNHIYTRTQNDGVSFREFTGNMLVAKFNHDVTRRQDPEPHTHCIIFNTTKDKDGNLKTIDDKDLYFNKELYDRIYLNKLAREHQLKGLETVLKDPLRGNWELKGIDEKLIDKYSQGKKEVDAKLAEKGLSRENASFWDKQIANKETREKKKDIDIIQKREEWRQDFKDHGQGDLIKNFKPDFKADNKQKIIDKSIEKLENKTAAFTKEDFLLYALREGSNGKLTLNEAENYMTESGKLIKMGKLENKYNDKSFHFEKNYYSTEKSIKLEESIYDRALAGKGQWQGIDKNIVEKHLNDFNKANASRQLNKGQQESIKVMCSSNDRVVGIIGDAGTGKTHSLAAAKNIFEAQGYEIEAVAPTNRAVGELKNAGFEKASTIHNLLNRMEKEAGNKTEVEKGQIQNDWNFNGLKPGVQPEVWIMDETSMVDNKIMAKFMEAAELKNAKVVLQGDPKQLQPVGPGKSLTNLINEGIIDIARLTENIRQLHAPENIQEAVNAAAKGDIRTTLEKLDRNIIEIKNRDERLSTMAKYYAKLPANERPYVLITSVNKDRIQLNNNVRDELKAKGELTGGKEFKTFFGPREFAAGDKIAFLKTDKLNGQKIAKNDSGNIVGIKGDVIKAYHSESKSVVSFSMKSYPAIDHGYSMTTHKIQGVSVNLPWANQDSKQGNMNNKNDFYIKISRTKGDLIIFTDNKPRLIDVTRSKMYQQVSKEQFKISVRDFKDRPPAFRDLPKAAQKEIIKGEKHNMKAEHFKNEALKFKSKSEDHKLSAQQNKGLNSKLEKKETRQAERLEKKAEKLEAKAERFSARAGKNFAKADKIIEKHNQGKAINKQLKGREDHQSKEQLSDKQPQANKGVERSASNQEHEKGQPSDQLESYKGHQGKPKGTDNQAQLGKVDNRSASSQEQVTEKPSDRTSLQPDQKEQKGPEKSETRTEVESKQVQEQSDNIEFDRKAEKDFSNREKSDEYRKQDEKEISVNDDRQQEMEMSNQVEKDPIKIFDQFEQKPETHEQNQESKEFQNISHEDLEHFNREQQLEPIQDEEYNHDKELEPIPDQEQSGHEIEGKEPQKIEQQPPERSGPEMER